jgi:hypothetical protein
MSKIGLCAVTGICPDRWEIQRLGAQAVRFHAYNFDDIDIMLSLTGPNVDIFVNLNGEYAEIKHDFSGWDTALAEFARRFKGRVKAVGCGNEFDLWHLQPPVGKPDKRLTPAFTADLAKRASVHLRPAGIQTVLASVASGSWPSYLKESARLAGDAIDAVDLHLYMKKTLYTSPDGVMTFTPNDAGWDTVVGALQTAHALTGKPVYATEAGIKEDDAGGKSAQARWVRGLIQNTRILDPSIYPAVFYFAWSDRVGTGQEQDGQSFGLRTVSSSPEPAWFAFEEEIRKVPPIVPAPIPTPVPPKEPTPVPTPTGQFIVGSGVLEQMSAHGDKPATDEIYHPVMTNGKLTPPGSHQYSETFGESGARYVFLFHGSKTLRFLPDSVA